MNVRMLYILIVIALGIAGAGFSSAAETQQADAMSTQSDCAANNPVVTLTTLGKGGNSSANAGVTHEITGNIVGGLDAYKAKANRIKICRGTEVIVQMTGAFVPEGVEIIRGPISCIDFKIQGATCTVDALTGRVRYLAKSNDGADVDRIALIPVD